MAEPPKRWLLNLLVWSFVVIGVVLAANALSMIWMLVRGAGPGDVLSIADDPVTLKVALFHLVMGGVFVWSPLNIRANILRRFAA